VQQTEDKLLTLGAEFEVAGLELLDEAKAFVREEECDFPADLPADNCCVDRPVSFVLLGVLFLSTIAETGLFRPRLCCCVFVGEPSLRERHSR
jgi:hypothetical protein